jgi:two-component system, OmpR family, sensor histidine kinase KdpD
VCATLFSVAHAHLKFCAVLSCLYSRREFALTYANRLLFQASMSLLLLIAATWLSDLLTQLLGSTGITMLFLLTIVWIAYAFELGIALVAACLAFAIINYFFVEPKHTFQVGSIESWASLISFLVVSVVIASLVKRLKSQTLLSNASAKQAEFARKLSECFAEVHDCSALSKVACEQLADQYALTFNVLDVDQPTEWVTFDPHALAWVASTGQSMGPYTHNWPDAEYWLIPFSRLPSQLPVMWVGANAGESLTLMGTKSTLFAIQSHVAQISQAYQRIQSEIRAKTAELAAQQEAMQSALLASISHDMRTPLTSILGASTALQQLPNVQVNTETAHLASIIVSQARHLTTTTENILSLIRLEALPAKDFKLDWQSPEEIMAMVTTHYQQRADGTEIQTHIDAEDALILANPHLLLQAIVNLIDNAKQVAQDAAPIRFEVYASEGDVCFVVEDTGPGFPPDFNVSQIKKFSTTRAHGLGLGLPIVQQITKLHDADFMIENKVNSDKQTGARVTLRFKRAQLPV